MTKMENACSPSVERELTQELEAHKKFPGRIARSHGKEFVRIKVLINIIGPSVGQQLIPHKGYHNPC